MYKRSRCDDSTLGWHRIYKFNSLASIQFKLNLKRSYMAGNPLNYDTIIFITDTGYPNGITLKVLNMSDINTISTAYPQALKLRIIKSNSLGELYLDVFLSTIDGVARTSNNSYCFNLYDVKQQGETQKNLLSGITSYDTGSQVIVPEELSSGEVLVNEFNIIDEYEASKAGHIDLIKGYGTDPHNMFDIDKLEGNSIYHVKYNQNCTTGDYPYSLVGGNDAMLFSNADWNTKTIEGETVDNLRYGYQFAFGWNGKMVYRNCPYHSDADQTIGKYPKWRVLNGIININLDIEPEQIYFNQGYESMFHLTSTTTDNTTKKVFFTINSSSSFNNIQKAMSFVMFKAKSGIIAFTVRANDNRTAWENVWVNKLVGDPAYDVTYEISQDGKDFIITEDLYDNYSYFGKAHVMSAILVHQETV